MTKTAIKMQLEEPHDSAWRIIALHLNPEVGKREKKPYILAMHLWSVMATFRGAVKAWYHGFVFSNKSPVEYYIWTAQ